MSEDDLDLENRQLCPDGSCTGVIGDDGRCKECGRSVAGEQVAAVLPGPSVDDGGDDFDSRQLCSDGNCTGQPKFEGTALSISVQTDDDAKRLFKNLSDGGTVIQPIIKTFFSSSFGMLKDRFGLMWMIITRR